MSKRMISMTLFFAVILLAFGGISVLTATPSTDVHVTDGQAELGAIDLAREVACVRPERFDYYPGLYLAPGQFADAPAPRYFTSADKSAYDYGTFRVTLHLPPGQTYALRAMAINFAQRLWIDGVEQTQVGWPGLTARDTIPAARQAVAIFTPQNERCEIVIQYANFVYRGAGEPYPLYISACDNILRQEQLDLLRVCLIAGCMLTIFVFYLGMYLFFQRKGYFLAFAASALAIAVRSLLIGDKFLTRLWPQLSWYAAMSAEYISLVVTVAAFILYIHGMFPKLLHRRPLTLYLGASAVFALLTLVTPPLFYSRLLIIYQVVSVLFGLYMIIRLVQRLRQSPDLETVLVAVSGALFLAAIMSESYLHSRMVRFGLSGVDQPAMMVFIFANMIALAVRYARTEGALAEMTQLTQLKNAFWSQASHDLKTPVAAMGLALERLQDVDDPIDRRRFLAAARRGQAELSRLVANLLAVSRLDDGSWRVRLQPLSACALCAQIQDKYEDTLAMSGIELDVAADTRAALLADPYLIWSVLDNLIYNAQRHTPAGGMITVLAQAADDGVTLIITDTGCGIPTQELSHIFQRGYAAGEAAGTGMGLYIVQNAMTAMGGAVTACNTQQGARFTLIFQSEE